MILMSAARLILVAVAVGWSAPPIRAEEPPGLPGKKAGAAKVRLIPSSAGMRSGATVRVKRDRAAQILASGMDPKAGLSWRCPDALQMITVSETERWFVGPPGTYKVEVLAAVLMPDGKTSLTDDAISVIVDPADTDPPGPGPVPPGPTPPGPTPPGPTPAPAPLPLPGVRG